MLAFYGRRRRLLGASIPAVVVDSLAGAIQRQEGYYPGSLAYRNNNPGNLIYVGQPGAHQGAGGFAAFDSYNAGLAALKSQITLNADRGYDAAGRPVTTVRELISSWAPSSDPRNDTAAYIASVASSTGFDPDMPLSSLGVPLFSVDVFGQGVDGSGAGAVDSAAGLPDLFDSEILTAGPDLSAFGVQDSVPWWLIGAGAFGLTLLARRL